MFHRLVPLIVIAGCFTAAPAFAQNAADERFQRLDRNEDGKLARDEVPRGLRDAFDTIDTNRDGTLTPREFAAGRRGAQRPERLEPLEPTHADVRYGEHERNVLDLYLAESAT